MTVSRVAHRCQFVTSKVTYILWHTQWISVKKIQQFILSRFFSPILTFCMMLGELSRAILYLLSDVLTFISCWKTSERGYSWCATLENTCRELCTGFDILRWALTCPAPSLLWGSVRLLLIETPEVGVTRGLNWCLDAAAVERLIVGLLCVM